ncbi:hypothetical protein [Rhodopila sp.]|jgi:hypothetical protein|uniref:hypothetical protein n=1 Tax=Rhodopila sp. TaxID=2480087 RepID=UPI002D0C7B1E|nr:hypothetical protein [Rhodopila sp.]HVZ08477.1 hypothetical protein [Rhodopila sp.]
MDLTNIIAAVPGVGPALPYLASAVSVCSALAVVLPRPNDTSNPAYGAAYKLVNFVALNFGNARNAAGNAATAVAAAPKATTN